MKALRGLQIASLTLTTLAVGLAVNGSPAFGRAQSSDAAGQSSTSSGQAAAPASAADAARKSRDQKKQAAKSTHVWDDDNIPKTGGVSVVGSAAAPDANAAPAGNNGVAANPVSPSAPAPAPAPGAPGAGAAISPKEQTQMQAAVLEAQEKIADLKKDVDIAERRFGLDSDSYYGRPNYAADREAKRALDSEQAQLEDKKQQLHQAEQMLAELQAKLGTAGAPAKP
jgi:hypothetical protein